MKLIALFELQPRKKLLGQDQPDGNCRSGVSAACQFLWSRRGHRLSSKTPFNVPYNKDYRHLLIGRRKPHQSGRHAGSHSQYRVFKHVLKQPGDKSVVAFRSLPVARETSIRSKILESKRRTYAMFIGCALCILPLPVQAQEDPYQITQNEKAACTGDAGKLCADTFPDEHRLLVCMKTNKASLSPTCLRVFSAGLKRRGL